MNKGRALSTSAYSVPSGLSLRANFSWTFVGNVVYAGCQWGVLVVLAKLGSPEMVGRFALGLAVTAPVIEFSKLQLANIQATDARREFAFGHYLGLRLTTTAVALLIIAGISLISGYNWETTLVVLAVGVAKAFEAISDAYYGLLTQRECMDRISKSMMIKGPLSLVAVGVGVYLTNSVFWAAAGLALAWALVLASYDLRNGALVLESSPVDLALGRGDQKAMLRPRWDVGTLVRLARLALPMGFVTLLISLNTSIPRYFVESYWGEEELGIFAAMAYITKAGATAVFALARSTSPRLAKYYATKSNKAFRVLLFKLVGISALLGVVGVVTALIAGQEILTLFYGPEYVRPAVFVWVMVGGGIQFVATSLGFGMTTTRHLRVQVLVYALVTGALTLACLRLVPISGLHGAAIALMIGAVVRAAGGLVVVVHALRESQKH
jgi:O-antigen/teichoic acid export membrane protein